MFTFGVSSIAITTGDPPRWLGWTGGVVVATLVVNFVLGLGSLGGLGLVWVLALAVTVTVRVPDPTDGAIMATP
jgi:hypothetical protein